MNNSFCNKKTNKQKKQKSLASKLKSICLTDECISVFIGTQQSTECVYAVFMYVCMYIIMCIHFLLTVPLIQFAGVVGNDVMILYRPQHNVSFTFYLFIYYLNVI